MLRTFYIVLVLVHTSSCTESDTNSLANTATFNLNNVEEETELNGTETFQTKLNTVPPPTGSKNTEDCDSTGNCFKTSSVPLPSNVSETVFETFGGTNVPYNNLELDPDTNDQNSSSTHNTLTNTDANLFKQHVPTGYDNEGNELDSEVRVTKKYSTISASQSVTEPTMGVIVTLPPLLKDVKITTVQEIKEPYESTTIQESTIFVKENHEHHYTDIDQNLVFSSNYSEQQNLVPNNEKPHTVKDDGANETITTKPPQQFVNNTENFVLGSGTSPRIVDSELNTEIKFGTGLVTDSSFNTSQNPSISTNFDTDDQVTTLSSNGTEITSTTHEQLIEAGSYLQLHSVNESEILEGIGERNRSYFLITDMNNSKNVTELPKEIFTEENPNSSFISDASTPMPVQITSDIPNSTLTEEGVESEERTDTTTNIPNFHKETKPSFIIPNTHGPILVSERPISTLYPSSTNETKLHSPLTTSVNEISEQTVTEKFFPTTTNMYEININESESTIPANFYYNVSDNTEPLQITSNKESNFHSMMNSSQDGTSSSLTSTEIISAIPTTVNNMHNEIQTEKTFLHFQASSTVDTSSSVTQPETILVDITQNLTSPAEQTTDKTMTTLSEEFKTPTPISMKVTTPQPIKNSFTIPIPFLPNPSISLSTLFSFSYNQTPTPASSHSNFPTDFTSNIETITSTTINTHLQTEVHREGKHIPFSTKSATSVPSMNGFIRLTSTDASVTDMSDLKTDYEQIHIEELSSDDRSNLITAIVQVSSQHMNEQDSNIKIQKIHGWLLQVLKKEFQNWTKDPFDDSAEYTRATPFGNVSVFYILPTPESNSPNITLTFIVYNEYKNDTLPVDFVLGILNFYSKELKESINASSAHFYHGYLIEENYMLSMILEKYGFIIFIVSLAVLGTMFLTCLVVYYRKKTRRSVHCLTNNKFQQNMQESVGLDLTPATIILQDEKGEKVGNGKTIGDDEGWLVPITDIPQAEESNVPFVQDTKL